VKYVFLVAFIVSTAIHLYASLKQNTKLRNYSKPFILLALLGFYALTARSVLLAIILALIFSWIGDVLLIPKGNNWFTAGGISFMIGHACFIVGYWQDVVFSKIPIVLIIFLAVFFIVTVVYIFSKLKEHLPKALFYPMFLYLLINGTMNCFAIFRCVSGFSAATLITAICAALFFLSDTTLFFVRFDKDSILKTHFIVMLTYSIGEFMIILGLL
jgi:uncharacterized membrane protein YhhN